MKHEISDDLVRHPESIDDVPYINDGDDLHEYLKPLLTCGHFGRAVWARHLLRRSTDPMTCPTCQSVRQFNLRLQLELSPAP